jgi:hypothetical protein
MINRFMPPGVVITCYIVTNCEERFYQSLGFCEN